MNVYQLPSVAAAREKLAAYRGKAERGVGAAKTVAEVAGAGYGAAYLSGRLGGPEGKKIIGLPLEVAVGIGCAVAAASGIAGRHSEDVLAVGLGSVTAFTSRLGFTHGMAQAAPPAVSGWAYPQPQAYPQPAALPYYPQPAALPYPAGYPTHPYQDPNVVPLPRVGAAAGVDIQQAEAVLDQLMAV